MCQKIFLNAQLNVLYIKKNNKIKSFFFIINFFNDWFLKFNYLTSVCAGSPLLCGLLSNHSDQGLLSVWVGFSWQWPLLFLNVGSRAQGLNSCSKWALVVASGLSCCMACEVFLDPGSDPCLLHWQADSLPVSHWGLLLIVVLTIILVALGLRCCAWRAFSSCGKRGPLCVAVCGLLIAVASLVVEHKLQVPRLRSHHTQA